MSPLFEVPESEMQPGPRQLLPTRRYLGDLDEATIQASEKNAEWQGIRVTFNNLTTEDSETIVIAMIQGNESQINLSDRGHSAIFTTQGSSKSVKIAAQQLAKLAQVLGVGEWAQRNDQRVWSVPGETPEEVVEALNEHRGTRIGFSVKQRVRKSGGEVVTNEQGEPILSDDINYFFALGEGNAPA